LLRFFRALPFGRPKGYTAPSDVATLPCPRGKLARATASAPIMNETDLQDPEAIKAKLETLRSEHRDLDDVIARLIEKAPFDQLQLQRLKKRKLGLKDQIIKLESQLIPDIIA
jgi:hypothetical protein